MPELPEVQTVVDHLRKYLYGEKIISIDSIWKKSLSNFNPANLFISNSGEEIKSINRRGKFIILNLPTCILAIHLRMTGKFYLLNDEQIPKHTTVIFGLESELIYGKIRTANSF